MHSNQTFILACLFPVEPLTLTISKLMNLENSMLHISPENRGFPESLAVHTIINQVTHSVKLLEQRKRFQSIVADAASGQLHLGLHATTLPMIASQVILARIVLPKTELGCLVTVAQLQWFVKMSNSECYPIRK